VSSLQHEYLHQERPGLLVSQKRYPAARILPRAVAASRGRRFWSRRRAFGFRSCAVLCAVGQSQSTLAAEVEGSSSKWDSQAKLAPGINPTAAQPEQLAGFHAEKQDPGARAATSGVVAQMTGNKSLASAPRRRSSRHQIGAHGSWTLGEAMPHQAVHCTGCWEEFGS
jgi:hypothetical protein